MSAVTPSVSSSAWQREGVRGFSVARGEPLADAVRRDLAERLSEDGELPTPERYLDAIYGPDWAGPAAIRGFDRRWFDTQVSNPSRTAESLPRAINLVLLRLLQALQAGQWARARALCIQIRAREPLAEVDALLARLGDAEFA